MLPMLIEAKWIVYVPAYLRGLLLRTSGPVGNMELETDKMEIVNAQPADVARIVGQEQDRWSIAILSRSSLEFIQAAEKSAGASYVLEFREKDKQFRACDFPTLESIQKDFLKYFSGDETWRDAHQWKEIL